MRNVINVLDPTGDIEITWDPDNPEEVAKARQMVLDLKSKGYSFFLVDGSEAPDEVTAGKGTLKARLVDAEELVPVDAPAEPSTEAPQETGRRGRRSTHAVATRPLRGG